MRRKFTIMLVLAMFFGFSQVSASEKPVDQKAVSEELAVSTGELLAAPVVVDESSIFGKRAIKRINELNKEAKVHGASLLMYVLAFFIPPLAVFLHTREIMPVLWNLLWGVLFVGIGAIIHAFIVLLR